MKRRSRDSKGRFLKRRRRRRRRAVNPHRSRRRSTVHRRRRNPVMARSRRRRRRRAHTRRRRRNPAMSLTRGLPIPNLMEVGVATGGGIASKVLARSLFKNATGWMVPLSTLGVGVGLAFVLKMLRMGQFARPVALGAGIAAATDAVKLTPFGAQLGYYTVPGDLTPVMNAGGGVGYFPDGFSNQLSGGDANYPSGFEASYEDIY